MELLRIIDANFNRVREGLRVIEDILRFSSSGNNFQAQLREIRHLFTFSYIKYFGSIPITKRNILEDIGKNNPPYRAKTSKEIVLRNFLRIEEGIRSIEECSAVVCPQSTHIWQELRFKIYAIEKRVQSILPEKEIPAFFIGVMLSGFDIKRLATVIEIVIKAKPDMLIFQIDKNPSEYIKYLKKIHLEKPIILITDRADIVLITNIDGVYITENIDMATDIKTIMPEKIIAAGVKSEKNIQKINNPCLNFVAGENKTIIRHILTKRAKKSKLLVAKIIHPGQQITNIDNNDVDGVILKTYGIDIQQTVEGINKIKKIAEDAHYGKET